MKKKEESDKTSGDDLDVSSGTFKYVREELRHWPYTIHQIHDTLDLSLIEGRAKQILFQALNTKNITAFVGSGVSAAYGRMGWSDWQAAQLSTTESLTETLLSLMDASIARSQFVKKYLLSIDVDDDIRIEGDVRATIRWLIHSLQRLRFVKEELRKLKSSFDLANDERGGFPGGDSLPVKFEIAQKLHDFVLLNRELFLSAEVTPESKQYESERMLTIVWGIRPHAAAGVPIDSLTNVQGLLPGTEAVGTDELRDDFSIRKIAKVTFEDMENCLDEYSQVANRPEGKMSFEELAKVLLVDECAHAGQLLESGLSGSEAEGKIDEYTKDQLSELREELNTLSMDNCKRDVSGIRQNPERFKVLQYFRIKSMNTLMKHPNLFLDVNEDCSDGWNTLFFSVSKRLSDYVGGIDKERVFLTPTSRFLVKMVLQLSVNRNETLKQLSEAGPLSGKDNLSRRSLIANRFDPLDRTVRQLNINRYLTTNYDFEIERFYQDMGFRNPELSESDALAAKEHVAKTHFDRGDYRVDGLGSVLWDTTFDPDNSSDLISFATATDGADAAVFHLHGRATTHNSLVITERNYQHMYLKTDDDRDMIDEGISLAFSATPILFLGLGMEEADVLRPLRQFISDSDRSRGYTAMVLLPADRGIHARSKFASALYLRYGTHTIFFGSGELELIEDGSTSEPVAIDWLFRVTQLIKALINITEDELAKLHKISSGEGATLADIKPEPENSEKKYQPKSSKELLEKVDEWVGVMGDDLDQPGVSPKKSALPFLFGYKSMDDLYKQVNPDRLDGTLELRIPIFTTQRPIKQSVARAERMKTDQVKVDGREFLSFYLKLLSDIVSIAISPPSDKLRKSTYLRELAAQKTALDGLKGGITTASLCAALTGIEKEWRMWWKQWQQRPPHRKPSIELHNPVQAVLWTNPLPRRYIRYRVHNSISDMSNAEDVQCNAFDKGNSVPALKTHIRSFDTFIEAVATRSDNTRRRSKNAIDCIDSSGRRFYTVAAETGLGKGTFFSMLTTRLGFSSYLQAAHIDWDIYSETPGRTIVMGGLFLNFSFATEIASTFDMSLDFVNRHLCWLYGLEHLLAELTSDDGQPQRADQIALLHEIIDISDGVKQRKVGLEAADRAMLVDLLQAEMMWESIIPTLLVCDRGDPILEDQLSRLPDTTGDRKVTLQTLEFLFQAVEVRSEIAVECLHRKFRGIGRSEYLKASSMKFDELSTIVEGNCYAHHTEFLKESALESLKSIRPRLLICLNSCELLFDSARRAKNMEIADFLGFLSSDRMSTIPFDIIAIGSEKRLGAPWNSARTRKNEKQMAENEVGTSVAAATESGFIQKNTLSNHIIKRRGCDSRAIHHINRRAKLSSIKFNDVSDQATSAIDAAESLSTGTNYINHIYFARIMDPTRLLVDNFLPLATILYLQMYAKTNVVPEKMDSVFRDQYRKFQKDQLDAWSQAKIDDIEKRTKQCRIVYQELNAETARAIDDTLPEQLQDLREYFVTRYRTDAVSDLEEWFKIRESLSSNRYCLTMLLAAAEEIALSEKSWLLGAEKASDFIRNTVNTIRNVSRSITEEIVLQAVFDVYARYHKVGDPDYDIELHHHLLRSVAVINSPTGSNVIVRLPSVRDYLNSIGDIGGQGLGRRRMVAKALVTLGDRGLAFRIAPHANLIKLAETRDALRELGDARYKEFEATDDEWPEHLEFRYSLHRLVQQYCITKLGSTAYEPVRVNTFTPSLYAMMPSGIPRLSHEAYRYMRALMVGLSQYPDIPHMNKQDPVWLFSAQDRPTSVQSLRAAMTLVRSTFSIAVVSRFEEYKSIPGEKEQRSRGYFETYKVRLRWIIRKAWELHEPEVDIDGKTIQIGSNSNPAHDGFSKINSLYRDEIVWLYNEVGLTCLVQGNLRDSVAHLRQAIALNADIEGHGGGRQFSLISLNLAVAQMERGRLSKSISRMEGICRREIKIKGRLYFLARGYLGLLMHLTGRRKRSKRLLLQAATYFENEREDRATAIFRNHIARLIVDRNPEKAMRELKTAREHAEAGGHEDIRHHILISAVRVSQLAMPDSHKRLEQDRLKVQDVEEYARVMGVPSLMCDALHTHALMLLENGDSTSSGRIMIRAMAIARRNDLQLRLSSMMTAYARILIRRGKIAASRRLLISSLEIAKKYEYSLQIDRTQRILEDEEYSFQRLI